MQRALSKSTSRIEKIQYLTKMRRLFIFTLKRLLRTYHKCFERMYRNYFIYHFYLHNEFVWKNKINVACDKNTFNMIFLIKALKLKLPLVVPKLTLNTGKISKNVSKKMIRMKLSRVMILRKIETKINAKIIMTGSIAINQQIEHTRRTFYRMSSFTKSIEWFIIISVFIVQ